MSEEIKNKTNFAGDGNYPIEDLKKFNADFGKTFCVKPFTELATSGSGHMKLCCFSGSVGENNRAYYEGRFDTVFKNNEDINEIRRKVRNGEYVKECVNCYNQERHGELSMRQEDSISLRYEYPKLFDEIVKNGALRIRSVDIKFGNKCNYACIMCAPDSSSLHSKEQEANPYPEDVRNAGGGGDIYYFEFPDKKMDELLDISPNLDTIKSTGGEPLLLDGFKNYIKKLADKGYSKNIDFTTVSNGTVDCINLLPYMENFQSFKLRWSIDGTGSVYNFIRYPGNFDRICLIRRCEVILRPSRNPPSL